MKYFLFIISLLLLAWSSYNILAKILSYHQLTTYDSGFIIGNILLLIVGLWLFMVQKKKIVS